MSRSGAPVSLADLAAAGVRLRPLEVATIVRELARQVACGDLPGVPSAHVIRLAPSGSVFIEGPVAAGGRSVARVAQLLETLLPGFDAPPEFRAPGGLRLVVARALGTVDLPAYPSLDALSDALARFAAPETAPVVRQLVASWAESVAAQGAEDNFDTETGEPDDEDALVTERVLESFAPAVPMPVIGNELTVSDVRRARRATGLTLTQVGERSRIPVALLRQLEWGYLRNWPAGHYGRTQLVRYARAAGLDEEVVVRAVWPLVKEESTTKDALPSLMAAPTIAPAAALSAPSETELELHDTPAPVADRSSRGARVLAALAIPALLAVALAPAIWQGVKFARLSKPGPAPTASVSEASTAAPASAREQERKPLAGARGPDRLVPTPPPASGVANRPVSTGDADTDGLLFSSIGSAMFYHGESDDAGAATTADAGGTGPVLRITRIVDDIGRNFHPRPSPDGRRIAFDSDRGGERAVYVADANGQHVRRVSGEGFAAFPSWSPDGKSLAFAKAEPGNPQTWNLWSVDLASGAAQRLTSHDAGRPWGASWFPDGQHIAYSLDDRLIVLNLQTGAERVHPSPRKGRLVRTPSVSPDGRRIIFQVHRDGAWLLELEDGSMRKVLSDASAEAYTWAPDGSRVAYYSRRAQSWGVWVMAPK